MNLIKINSIVSDMKLQLLLLLLPNWLDFHLSLYKSQVIEMTRTTEMTVAMTCTVASRLAQWGWG